MAISCRDGEKNAQFFRTQILSNRRHGRASAHGARVVWVDPNPENEKALALYARLGFARRPMPEYLAGEKSAGAVYMELARA